jgi:SWI/SNF-related matrix-associated actin-dependent regulator 1 of chromatin subfamily A
MSNEEIQVITVNTRISTESRERIISASRALNSVCDGAREKDGMGFNGGDSKHFKFILRLNNINDNTVLEMYQKLRLYKNQLKNFGISYDSLKPVIEEKNITIDPTWNNYIMPVGKYKGKTLGEISLVDENYIEWVGKEFSDVELRRAAKYVSEKKAIPDMEKPKVQDFIKVSLDGENLILNSSYGYKDLIKETLSFRYWNKDKKQWETKLSLIDEVIKAFPNAEYTEELKGIIAKRKTLKSLSNAMDTKENLGLDENFGKGKTLMPFQKAGIDFLQKAEGRAMLADEMGTGKTIQSAGYLQLNKNKRPALIVCPASLKFNWKRELENWLVTDDVIQVINGGKPEKITGSIIIINYDIAGKHEQAILKTNPKIMICDESHMLKNNKAKRTQVLNHMAKNINSVILLTGTPVLNKPVELFSQLNIINPLQYPESMFFTYAKKYCDAEQTKFGWNFSGASRLGELEKEIKAIMIRRTKEMVLPELPEKRRSPIYISLDNVSKYNTQKKEFKKWLKQNKFMEEKDLDVLPELEYLKQMCIEGKMKNAISWLEDSFIANGQKVIVFATHQKTIDELMNKFSGLAVKIDGRSSQKEREESVTKFQNDKNILMFIGNIKAAGVGLTLTAASDVVFLEFDWTPAIHDQAEDRAHRIGQKNSVNCYYLIAENTIDEMIFSMLERKRKITQGVTGDKKELTFRMFIEKYFEDDE